MKRIIMNFANFCKDFYKKITGNVQYYYLRYFSKKATKESESVRMVQIERIAVGKPTKGSRGTMLYNDLIQGGTRSFCLQNLCEQRKITTQNELIHFKKYLSPSAQNLSLKTASFVVTPQTVCKPIKESTDFAGDQIRESGYTAEQEEMLLWEEHQHQYQIELNAFYDNY